MTHHTNIDRDGNALEPGALYCCFLRTNEFESARDGEMVYWTGTELVDENGEPGDFDFDFLVRQSGAAINPDMIEPGEGAAPYDAATATGMYDAW